MGGGSGGCRPRQDAVAPPGLCRSSPAFACTSESFAISYRRIFRTFHCEKSFTDRCSLPEHGLKTFLLAAVGCFALLASSGGCDREVETDVPSEALVDAEFVEGETTDVMPVHRTREDGGGPFRWIATTGHVYDALRTITDGSDIELTLFCGPGVDPHGFSPSMSDVRSMESADAIFYNGFHLEAKLIDLLEDRYADKSWSMASSFPDDAKLNWVENGVTDPDAPFDPHIWNHLRGWATCVEGLVDRVCQLDPAGETRYRDNGDEYIHQMRQTDRYASDQFASLPENSRVLVSAHDAFNYFAKVYDFETVSVLGIGNDAEADIRTMRDVAATVVDRRVPVIFLESITNPRLTEALQEACEARDWSVQIADQPLYSDDLGVEPPVNTFLGAFKHNVDLIVASLQSDAPESSTVVEEPAARPTEQPVGSAQ